jgi:hypothetical protein
VRICFQQLSYFLYIFFVFVFLFCTFSFTSLPLSLPHFAISFLSPTPHLSVTPSLYPFLHPVFLLSLPSISVFSPSFSTLYSSPLSLLLFLSQSVLLSLLTPLPPTIIFLPLSFFWRFLAPPHTCKSVHLSSAPYHMTLTSSTIWGVVRSKRYTSLQKIKLIIIWGSTYV